MEEIQKREILWMLIDLQYISESKDLANIAGLCKYFSSRLIKSGHLSIKKEKLHKLVNKWRALSNWNRLNHPPSFKTLGNYTEIISGNGSGMFRLPKINGSSRMVASIWVKTSISNFFTYNQTGYTWSLACGNRLVDRTTFKCRLDKWKKLDFFKGGALFPVDLFVEGCYLYCSSDPFADVKITWVYTNAHIKQLKKYNYKWINSQKQFKWINKNRYLDNYQIKFS